MNTKEGIPLGLLKLFCDVDDFGQAFPPHEHRAILAQTPWRVRTPRLSPSASMTILMHLYPSCYCTCKAYYTAYVLTHRRPECPGLVSSQLHRLVELTLP